MTNLLKHKGYIGKVDFDADAKLLHGEVVGTTPLRRNKRDAIHA